MEELTKIDGLEYIGPSEGRQHCFHSNLRVIILTILRLFMLKELLLYWKFKLYCMEKNTSKLIAEIMRKGGTLLAEPCPKCGGLLVKYKGKTFCPKCDNITSITQIELSQKGNDIAVIQQQIIAKIKDLLASKESDLFVSKSILYYSKTLIELKKLGSENNEENSNT